MCLPRSSALSSQLEGTLEITSEQIARFREDGFVSVDRLLDEQGVEAARNAFDSLFRGEFERGILPDEVNWKEGKSDRLEQLMGPPWLPGFIDFPLPGRYPSARERGKFP
jgi:hypothetical protein